MCALTAAPRPYLGVSSVLGRDLSMADAGVQGLSAHVGDLALVSAPLPFPWTDHYQDELGPTPVRRIVSFQQLMDPSQLGALKRTTGRLEVSLTAEERLMPLPWTYPDYADDVVRHLFNRLRALLLVRRRLEGKPL